MSRQESLDEGELFGVLVWLEESELETVRRCAFIAKTSGFFDLKADAEMWTIARPILARGLQRRLLTALAA
jgi:hypothetical protein